MPLSKPGTTKTERINLDRNRLLYGAIERSVGATFLLAIVLAATMSTLPTASTVRAVLWMACVLAVIVWRVSVKRQYVAASSDPKKAARFGVLFVYGAAAAGAVWGLGALLLFPEAVVGQVFMGFVFAGVSAGAITSIGPSRRAAVAFLSLTLLPLAGRLLLSPGLVPQLMGWMTFVFLVFLFGSSREIARVLEENFKLRENDEMREFSLVRQKELLERVGRIAAIGGWTYDLTTEKLEWSREVYNIYGVKGDEPPPMAAALQPYEGDARISIQSALANAIETGEPYNLEVPFRALDGRRLWVRAQGEPEYIDGEMRGIVGTFQDITETRRTRDALRINLRALQRLYHITSSPELDLPGKLNGILDLGLDIFDLDLGIVSRIEGQSYVIRSVRGSGELPPIGSEFELGRTYCSHTLRADAPTSFHHAGKSSIRDHPCYLDFGLEAYIGSPIIVDGERYGTVNFSSPNAREAPFDESDHTIVKLFAEWIGFELSRERVITQLADSEERVRLLLESVGEGVYGLDLEGRATFINPAALSMLGYQTQGILGKKVQSLIQGDVVEGADDPNDRWPTKKTLEEGVVSEATKVIYTSAGTPISTEMISTPVRKDGEIVGAVVAFRDITMREEAERRLMSTLAMQSAILDSANYSIIATDVEGVIHTFSRGSERMLGYDSEEVVGSATPLVFHDPEEVSKRAADEQREEEDGELSDFGRFVAGSALHEGANESEWTYVRKDGSQLPVLLSITAVRDDRNAFMGYLCIAADLTERKRVEQLKNEFVSTVSHELRTPLTSIRGSLGLIAGGAAGALPDRAKGLIDIASRNSERLIFLINDILDMEKIESGKMDISLIRQPIRPLVEQAVQANEAYAEEHGVTLVLDPDAADAEVEVDEIRMMQVLTNLMSNASKFSEIGSSVNVGIEVEGLTVRVSVEDKGPGISEEFRPRIFEKFSQADSSDRRAKGGTGLGLSITRALVNQMGGNIWFETEVDIGTTFQVAFPRLAVVSDESETAEGRGRILICSIDEDGGEAMCNVLENAGYETELADTPGEVRERIIEGGEFAAFLLDLTFPKGEALELVHWIRAFPATSAHPIIAVSARVEDDKLALNGDIPMIDLLGTPLNPENLLTTLSRLKASHDGALPLVLYVEDDQDLQRMVAELGRQLVRFRAAGSLLEARNALQEDQFDLILLDLGLPDGSGWDLLDSLQSLDPRPPVVIFSATPVDGSDARRVEATLLKSQVSEADVLATLRQLLSPAE